MAMRCLRSLVRGLLAAGFLVGASCMGVCSAVNAAEPERPLPVCQIGEAGQHGTQINWVASAEAAASQATEQGKLVFLMQISGNFAREEFT